MKIARGLWIVSLSWMAAFASAQAPSSPSEAATCPPSNAAQSVAAEIVGRFPAQTFYPYKKGCSPDAGTCDKGSILKPGWPVEVVSRNGNWTCIWTQDSVGSGPSWVRNDQVKTLKIDSYPSRAEWRGTWWQLGGKQQHGTDRLIISETKTGALRLHGNAYWYGAVVDGNRVTHFGAVDGQAKPDGNQLHVIALNRQGNPAGCEVAIKMVGKYLRVADNNQCGGMNVRFSGFYAKQQQTAK